MGREELGDSHSVIIEWIQGVGGSLLAKSGWWSKTWLIWDVIFFYEAQSFPNLVCFTATHLYMPNKEA
jgi:hypothetical protein